jgi:hypothetical protein
MRPPQTTLAMASRIRRGQRGMPDPGRSVVGLTTLGTGVGGPWWMRGVGTCLPRQAPGVRLHESIGGPELALPDGVVWFGDVRARSVCWCLQCVHGGSDRGPLSERSECRERRRAFAWRSLRGSCGPQPNCRPPPVTDTPTRQHRAVTDRLHPVDRPNRSHAALSILQRGCYRQRAVFVVIRAAASTSRKPLP